MQYKSTRPEWRRDSDELIRAFQLTEPSPDAEAAEDHAAEDEPSLPKADEVLRSAREEVLGLHMAENFLSVGAQGERTD